MNWLDGDILSWPFLHANGKWKHSIANAVESRNSPQADRACVKCTNYKPLPKNCTWPDVDSYRDEGRASKISMIFWWARYLCTRVLSARLPAFVLHLEGNLRTIVLDATVDLLLSHAVMMSFFLGNLGSGYASQSFTTSRKRTLEWAPSLPPASITFRRGFPRKMTRWLRGRKGGTNIVFWFRFAHSSRLVSTYACGCVPL